jgi:hypothetical protein
MIWAIVIILIVIVLYRFFTSLNRDNHDLQNQTLSSKFQVIVDILNDHAFSGNGIVTTLDKRSFNLYENGQNQIINFHYSTGHLTITWKYKYFQKELVHERQFSEVRNLSIFEQQKMGESLVREMISRIESHKEFVLKDSPNPQLSTKLSQKMAIQLKMESDLRDLLRETFNEVQRLPEMMHGVLLMQAAGNFSKNLKDNYSDMRDSIEGFDDFFSDEVDFNNMIDQITSKVLDEFIETPN